VERDILERLQRLEDVQSIIQMIAAYGPAADACVEDWLAEFWSDDVVYDMGTLGTFTGKAELMPVYREHAHQTLIAGGSAHIGSIPHVTVEGDRAQAVHYATLFRHHQGHFELFRLAAAVWSFRRRDDGRWEATERVLRNLTGDPTARDLLGSFVEKPRQASEQAGAEQK